FIDDIANVLKWEDLKDVVLVGHSLGGSTISGVADRMRDRVRQLVYLDALMLENGQSPLGILPKDIVEARIKAARESSGGLSLPGPKAGAVCGTDPRATGLVGGAPTPS